VSPLTRHELSRDQAVVGHLGRIATALERIADQLAQPPDRMKELDGRLTVLRAQLDELQGGGR
jgi:hypothetical protein